jgi:hypothetical protein
MMNSPSKVKLYQSKGVVFSAEAEPTAKPLSEADLKAIEVLEKRAAEDGKKAEVGT